MELIAFGQAISLHSFDSHEHFLKTIMKFRYTYLILFEDDLPIRLYQ